MFVGHLQVQPGQITAKAVKALIALVERMEWPDAGASIVKAVAHATTEARSLHLIDLTAKFVNYGALSTLVDRSQPVAHTGRGLLISVNWQSPRAFYVADEFVRIPEINFDFEDYAIFEFGRETLKLCGLTDIDKTLLRLGSTRRPRALSNGRVVDSLC